MKTELKYTEDYALLLDLEAGLQKGDLFLEKELIINIFPNYLTDLEECNKILAYKKLNPQAKDLELPMLPDWNEGVDIDELAANYASDFIESPELIDLQIGAYIEGFKKNQELNIDKQFTSKNLRDYLLFYIKNNSKLEDELFHKKSDELGRTITTDEYENILNKVEETVREKFIKQFQQPKLPTNFIPEFEDAFIEAKDCNYIDNYYMHYKKCKTINTPQGKQLIGTYEF